MSSKYAPTQIVLHWVTFILIVVAYCTMEFRGLATRGSWQHAAMILTHFSAGSAILVLMLSRLILRVFNRSPAIVPKPPHWQIGLAHLTHLMLYLLFIALPVLGLLSRFYLGKSWEIFGISMPVSGDPDFELSDTLTYWHKTVTSLGYWLVGIHTVAALAHHYLFKDNTLLRMMPAHKKR